MIIDFKDIATKIISHFKGGEKEMSCKMYADAENKIMYNELEPGASIGYHQHLGNSEIIYLLSGKARVVYDGEEQILYAGQVHYCPMNHFHSLLNIGEEKLIFFAVVPEHPNK